MGGNKSLKARGETSLNKYRGSGFEEGFADPPVTPAEYATERQIYDPNRSFPDRIEECIQRYMARRRLTSERRVFFNKYLALGGIDTDQRQFTGTAEHAKDMKEDEEYDADHVREVAANAVLSREWQEVGKYFNPSYPEHWDVDFAGVVAGFLGDWLPKATGLWASEFQLAADTILNFLRYVQHHDVCPEYTENLVQACKICVLARTEIPGTGAVGAAMPGDFNLACQILFCSTGRASTALFGTDASDDLFYEVKPFDGAHYENAWDTGIIAPANFDAERVFKATISIHEPGLIDRVLQQDENPIRVVKTHEDAFAVKEIIRPIDDTINVYNGIKNKNGVTRTIKPMGRVVLVPTIIEDGWDNHPTLAAGRPEGDEDKTVSIYLEHATLGNLKEGMKLRLTICQLNIDGGGSGGGGVAFIKACSEILPTFHTFLPQALMMNYKPSRPSDRPPPSVGDPDAAERAMLEQVAEDAEDADKAERRADPELDRQMKEAEEAEALMKVMERVKVEE
ncbi:hypothetical protein diail_1733 [Diaporthe ilicicola]|nr:hypothetical protein diail_1733 [Diaporthe ilicicola]